MIPFCFKLGEVMDNGATIIFIQREEVEDLVKVVFDNGEKSYYFYNEGSCEWVDSGEYKDEAIKELKTSAACLNDKEDKDANENESHIGIRNTNLSDNEDDDDDDEEEDE
ncbi:MAG: hypothetical protein FWH35_00695 [Treponema sp.]|nr:hypothetical protein [Treponema sp.]